MSAPAHVASESRPGRPGAGGAKGGPSERSERLGTITNSSSTAGQSREGGKASGLTWYALKRRDRHALAVEDVQEKRNESRAERWALRRAFRRVTKVKRVKACGRAGLREDGSVVLRATVATAPASTTRGGTARIAGFAGLFRCGSVWLCAECSARIAAKRAAELEQLLARIVQGGGWPVLVTLTMRHHRQHDLALCVKAASDAWASVTSGRRWQTDKDVSDYAGYVRALEVTESLLHGWHVHYHAIVVFNRRPSDDMIAHVTGGMFARWSGALVRAGLPAPTQEHGLDVRQLDATAAPEGVVHQSAAWARYVVKGLAEEAVLGTGKDAKGANRTIRQLMRDALLPQAWESPEAEAITHTVDLRALDRLREYEAVMPGRRQLEWSRGRHDLRARFELGEEESDEAIVAEELDGEDVAVLPRETWEVVEPRATELLAVTERGGADAARRWLDALGVQWWHPTGLTDQHRYGEPPGS